MISRHRISEEIKNVTEEQRPEVLTNALNMELEYIEPEFYEMYGISDTDLDEETNEAPDQKAIEAARNDFLNGLFGDTSTEPGSSIETDSVDDFFRQNKAACVLQVNEELIDDTSFIGEIYGTCCKENGKFYAIGKCEYGEGVKDNHFKSYGLIVPVKIFYKLLNPEAKIEGYDYFGAYIDNDWLFYRTDCKRTPIAINIFSLVTRLFSRNSGLLESDVMADKTAILIGCGSVGSLIALELARAGVGNFVLADKDTLEIHNICRHQLGFRDLGRYKVDAVKDAIKNINPFANVITFRGYIQDMPMEYISDIKNGIIVGTGDNRESNAVANELADKLTIPFVSTGCWTRAHAGECFYWYPGCVSPKYRDAFKNIITDERKTSHQNYFADDTEERELNFEPGGSTDLSFVTLVGIKIILDLLNLDTDSYTTRVIDYLTHYTMVCNTNKPEIGGKNAEAFPHPLFISNNIYLQPDK